MLTRNPDLTLALIQIPTLTLMPNLTITLTLTLTPHSNPNPYQVLRKAAIDLPSINSVREFADIIQEYSAQVPLTLPLTLPLTITI